MSYYRVKVEYYKEESSRTKPCLLNMNVSIKPPVLSHLAALANYKPNVRINDAFTCLMGTSAEYRLNVYVTNSGNYFDQE